MKLLLSSIFLLLTCFFSSSYANTFKGEAKASVKKLKGENTQDVLDFVKNYLPANPVIVEAGGCDGGDSSRMAQFWPKGKIYSFEPIPEFFNMIKDKARAFPNLIAIQKALSDRNGFATFYLSEWYNQRGGSSSLLPPKEHLNLFPAVSFPDVMEVETISLDDWARAQGVSKIDFFWLDMQGYELNMLKASQLAPKASVIFLEVEFVELYEGQYLYKDIKSWMDENGFRLAAADFDESKDTNLVGNAIFVKKR